MRAQTPPTDTTHPVGRLRTRSFLLGQHRKLRHDPQLQLLPPGHEGDSCVGDLAGCSGAPASRAQLARSMSVTAAAQRPLIKMVTMPVRTSTHATVVPFRHGARHAQHSSCARARPLASARPPATPLAARVDGWRTPLRLGIRLHGSIPFLDPRADQGLPGRVQETVATRLETACFSIS